MASLIVMKGPNPGERLPLEGNLIVMGRNPDCGVVVPGHAVSRQHAQIVVRNGQFFIEDLKSRNRTFVNNQEITQPTLLKPDDRIKICDFLYRFAGDHAAPLPNIPIPPGLVRGGREPDVIDLDQEEPQNTVEHTLGRVTAKQVLETQPADKLRALLDVATALGKSHSSEELLPQIADVLFQVFKQADRCFIILRDESNQLLPKVIKARRANTETTTRFSKTIVRKVLDGLESIISEDASSDSNIGTAQSIAEFRIRSVMCVPLASNEGRGIGVIQLDTQDRSKKFTRDDLQLLIAVAHQAGVALENVRMQESLVNKMKLERDVDLARKVQASFLPRSVPEVPGYEFFAHYEAAQQVGGDYFDFVNLPGGKLAIPLGDVAGKGVPAALFMAKSTTETRFSLLSEPDPALAMAKLNDVLTPIACELDRFVTLALAILEPATHQVTVLNAAQMLPMIYRGVAGTLEYALSEDDSGLMLGAIEGLTYNARTLTLEPGDSILLFSDGVPDALSTAKEQFTLDGVFKCAQATIPGEVFTPRQLGQRIINAVKRHSAGEPQFDDTTMVVFGRLIDSAPATTPPGEKTVKLKIARPVTPVA